LSHGYPLLVSSTLEYQKYMNDTGRHAAWVKVNFMLDMAMRHPECEWLMWLDSDAFFWMYGHTMSLQDWLAMLPVHEVSPDFFTRERHRLQSSGYLPLAQQSAAMMLALNGVMELRGQERGYPSIFLDTRNDYLCSGVFIVRNNVKGREILADWIDPPSPTDDDTMSFYTSYANRHPYEQRALNGVVAPRHHPHMSVFAFRDFHFRYGSGVRHVWRQHADERMDILAEALWDVGLVS
jgi:hypothetical protein